MTVLKTYVPGVGWEPVLAGEQGPKGDKGDQGDDGLMAPASGAETIAGTDNTKAVTPASLAAWTPVIDVRRYGAKGDGTTNDSAAIQAALDAAGTPQKTIYFPPGNYLLGTTGVVAHSSVQMAPSATLLYTGTGTCFTLDSTHRVNVVVNAQRNPIAWHTGVDTSSIGIRIRNSDFVRLSAKVFNFNVGIDMQGDQTGTSYGVTDCLNVRDNMIGFRCSKIGTGWANQHEVRGQIRISSGPTSGVAGSRYVDLTGAGNNTTFINLSFEYNAPEFLADITVPYVTFLNCRYENPSPIRLNSGSYGCQVIGGYSNAGPASLGSSMLKFTLAAGANYPTIISHYGSQLNSDNAQGSGEGLVLRTSAPAVNAFTVRTPYTTSDALRSELTGDKFAMYRRDGKGLGTTPQPIFNVDAINARLYLGDGVAAPTNYIDFPSSNIATFTGTWRFPAAAQFTATGTSPALHIGQNVNDPKIFTGTGSPETVVTAGLGSLYLRRDGATGTSFYVKEAGAGLATGWVGYQPATVTINAQTGTAYTLVLTDASKLVTLSNAAAIALTVPTNAAVAFPVGATLDVAQLGAGQVTVSGAGTTLNGTPGLKTRAQYSRIRLIKTATDTWLLSGDLSA